MGGNCDQLVDLVDGTALGTSGSEAINDIEMIQLLSK